MDYNSFHVSRSVSPRSQSGVVSVKTDRVSVCCGPADKSQDVPNARAAGSWEHQQPISGLLPSAAANKRPLSLSHSQSDSPQRYLNVQRDSCSVVSAAVDLLRFWF
ncbi:hypothetical protein CCH79_00018909 [Gambusia affinis]|uniref:Uncharacterized protein n=1 Tax=Gambusia affinis TaxID=33528 RepID=A0A315VJ05_GAMAF|nr:hypothetical protein CCH79_00018909 [Gambusia affinis]